MGKNLPQRKMAGIANSQTKSYSLIVAPIENIFKSHAVCYIYNVLKIALCNVWNFKLNIIFYSMNIKRRLLTPIMFSSDDFFSILQYFFSFCSLR